MTSTPFNIGLSDSGRLSSRVLRPPGGGHTDIFGGEPEQPRGRRRAPENTKALEENISTTSNGSEENGQVEREQAVPLPEPAPVSEPAAAPAQQQTAAQPVSKTEAQPQAPPPAEPPKRTRVPPGGFSSGLW